MNWHWAELAFGSKKPLSQLAATFILAPRELSPARFKQLAKRYLPQGNMLLGLAAEDYILGFEGQPQFRTLAAQTVQPLIDKVNASPSQAKIHTLTYAQRDLPYILQKLRFARVVGINGSWQHSFHLRPEYYLLAEQRTPYALISPFADEAEAKTYAASLQLPAPPTSGRHTEAELMAIADTAAQQSFDHTKQTGAALARPEGSGHYRLLATAFNRVVPYQTYALHHGASREQHFSPPHDLNYYDTNHAEAELIVGAGQRQVSLEGTTLFINLLPCPTCARLLSATAIAEVVYREDHSDGYAVHLLELAGKTVRRLVSPVTQDIDKIA